MGGIFNNVYNDGTKPSGQFPPVELSASKNSKLIVPTVLQVASEELEYWTNMTCLYDKQWSFNPRLSTVPISFFHITSVREITTASISEKRVIVYQAPKGSGGSPAVLQSDAYRANMEVIMDNVVVRPKLFQMEVIIPATLIGPYIQQGMQKLNAMVEFMSQADLVGTDTAEKIESGMRIAQTTFGIVNGAAKVADKVLGAMETGSTQISTMNKNSIEAMVGAGHVLCFKKWTGYDYSYGVLTNVDISPKPTEDGVYRGTLTFQETPILNISQRDTKKSSAGWNGSATSLVASQAARYINLALALPFMKITGVVDEAGAPGTESNVKSDFLSASNTTSLF